MTTLTGRALIESLQANAATDRAAADQLRVTSKAYLETADAHDARAKALEDEASALEQYRKDRGLDGTDAAADIPPLAAGGLVSAGTVPAAEPEPPANKTTSSSKTT